MTIALGTPGLPLSRARLRLAPSDGGPHRIDGAWWPRTDDLTVELPDLLRGLPHAWSRIIHVTVNGTLWSAFPGRMLVANHVLHLHHSTSSHATPTACLLAPGMGRWDLVVVPPQTEEAEALHLMATAPPPPPLPQPQPQHDTASTAAGSMPMTP
ncbi:DUF5994 family protein [Streptomyces kanamyceticus]|uniref:DUF5994 family protein n=1 Tax=Streptomyces kanamyceticus TaxID=1967 RepID=UPI0007C86DFA|nr:DUF5994 family protein [Streptomyces kanamyceticus]